MEFEKLVEKILSEDVVSGGAGSAFGSGVQATSSEFSGDTYAPGDARTPKSLYGGSIITRMGMKRKSKSKAPKRKSKRKKK
jgi:hypothetical protein